MIIPPPLVVGDPLDHRATFTRFIMPIRWARPAEKNKVFPGKPEGLHFREATENDWLHAARPGFLCGLGAEGKPLDRARTRYFSAETNELLFNRARWFVLDESDGLRAWAECIAESTLEGITRSYKIAFRAPALILFEADSPDTNELSNGFLVHEAWFPDESQPPTYADFLVFNEAFRYWNKPFDKHEEACGKKLLDPIHNALCQKIDSKLTAGLNSYMSHWLSLFKLPVYFAGDQEGSGDYHFTFAPQNRGCGFSDDFPPWLLQPDNRSLVLTCAVIEDRFPGHGLLHHGEATQVEEKTREWIDNGQPGKPHSKCWHDLLNVDRPEYDDFKPSLSGFATDWLSKRTYTRWAELGTLYGFSEHSMAVLCGPAYDKKTLARDHGDPELSLHVGRFYFDMTLLLYYTRCTMFRLSARSHELTRTRKREAARSGREAINNEWAKGFEDLRWRFQEFENLYKFPMLGNQQQHLEMFALQRQFLDVEELYEEIRKEISSSDELYQNFMEHDRSRSAMILNKVGAIVAVVGLGLGCADGLGQSALFVGLANCLGECPCLSWLDAPLIAFIYGTGLAGVALKVYKQRLQDKNQF